MEGLLWRAARLSRRCDQLRITRTAVTRRTMYRRQFERLNLPLKSIFTRLRRGMVQCGEEEFAEHVRRTLICFEFNLRELARIAPNLDRSHEIMTLLQAAAEAASFD